MVLHLHDFRDVLTTSISDLRGQLLDFLLHRIQRREHFARVVGVLLGSEKDTQTPRRINISTPSVADVGTPPSAHRCMRTHTIAVEWRPMRQRCAARQVAVRRSAGALARARTQTCSFFYGTASELLSPLAQA